MLFGEHKLFHGVQIKEGVKSTQVTNNLAFLKFWVIDFVRRYMLL